MKTEDLPNSTLQQNPVNPKMLQESLRLGKVNIRMMCFRKKEMTILSSVIIREMTCFSRNPGHTKKKRKKFKKLCS